MPAGCDSELAPLHAIGDAVLRAELLQLARERARLDARELKLVGEFDRRRAFIDEGATSTKVWLAHETGAARAVAGSRVRLAKRLRRMPLMAVALGAGRVTVDHARSMGRCLTPRTLGAFARDEELLLSKAEVLEADDFDRVVTMWLQVNDPDGPEPGGGRESEAHASRTLGGRVAVDADLDVDDGAEFLAELEARYDELWRRDQGLADGDPLKERGAAERNAEALVEMARRSSTISAEPDGEAGGPRPRRAQILAVADVAALAGDPAGAAHLDDGTLLPRSVLDRWACDSAMGRVVMAPPSIPFDVGRVSYTPTPGQRRALVARDRGCRVPGCKRKPRWCEAHHVVFWPAGPTTLDNLVLLCARHHKLVHAGVLELVPAGIQRWEFRRADGTPLRQRPPPTLAA